MYEFLVGSVADRQGTRLILEVGGIGYDLAVPLGADFGELAETRAWTHFVVREDSQQLYGFADRPTRDLFRLLQRSLQTSSRNGRSLTKSLAAG